MSQCFSGRLRPDQLMSLDRTSPNSLQLSPSNCAKPTSRIRSGLPRAGDIDTSRFLLTSWNNTDVNVAVAPVLEVRKSRDDRPNLLSRFTVVTPQHYHFIADLCGIDIDAAVRKKLAVMRAVDG